MVTSTNVWKNFGSVYGVITAVSVSSLPYSPPSLTETTCLLLTYVLNLGVNTVDHTVPSNNTCLTLNAYVCSCSTPSFSSPANSSPVNSAIPKTHNHLRSANRQLLAVLRYRLNTYGRRAFSVAGPKVWNSLPDFIRDPTIRTDCFRRLLKLNVPACSILAHSAR